MDDAPEMTANQRIDIISVCVTPGQQPGFWNMLLGYDNKNKGNVYIQPGVDNVIHMTNTTSNIFNQPTRFLPGIHEYVVNIRYLYCFALL